MNRILFILATMFVTFSVNSQTVVQWYVSDTNMGTVYVMHPVVYHDTIDTDSSIVSYDTVGDIVDTSYTTVTKTIIGTIYNLNEWFLTAMAYDGQLFSHWVVEWIGKDSNQCDTNISNVLFINVEDSQFDTVFCTAYFTANTKEIGLMNVYPNPTTGMVRFDKTMSEYYILNENGQVLVSGMNSNMVDMSRYPAGVYIIKSDRGYAKFIKN